MHFGLYRQFFLWTILNVVLLGFLALGIVGGVLLFKTDNIYPPQLFNGNIASIFRFVSAELQYKSPEEQNVILQTASEKYGLQFHLCFLAMPETKIPQALVKATTLLPRPPYSLCPTPDELLSTGQGEITPSVEMEAGIIPQQYAIFFWERTSSPMNYWYARTILVADEVETVHYALLAVSSPSIDGEGHYFDLGWPLLVLLFCLLVSFVWWCPFIHRLMQPIVSLTRITREIATGNCDRISEQAATTLREAGARRSDELGCLLQATSVMTERVQQQVHGQRRFIRHIAHELNSPLARLKLGLAVLENRVEGDNRRRVLQLAEEGEQISMLVEDVLGFLRSEAIPQQPLRERVALRALLQNVLREESMGHDVRLEAPEEIHCLADPVCLRRALANVVRNAVRYGGKDNPVQVCMYKEGCSCHISVTDSGPGVSEEDLQHIVEPFYRGAASKDYPGGSGLGLSIVRHGVEACNGRLHYENVKSGGFSVTISLPCM